MNNIEDTTNAAIASVATKSTVAGASASAIGWLTTDRYVALGGLLVAVLGFAVNALFRWLDRRDKRRQMRCHAQRAEAEEARAVELHELKLRVLNTRLAAEGKSNGDEALDAVADLTP